MQAPALRWPVPSGQAIAGFGVAGAAGVLVLYPIFYLHAGLARRRRPRRAAADRVRARQFRRRSPQYSEILLQHAHRLACGDRDGAALRLRDRLDPVAHERARPAHARAADGGALLRDAAARRASRGACSARRRAASSTRSGARSGATRHLIDIDTPVRHRLGHGAVRGLGRLRDDRRGDEVDGPGARGSLAGDRRRAACGRCCGSRCRSSLPGVLGAAIFVFAEMLGSFSAALVLGTPDRFYVVTTAMYQLVSQYPPRIPLAAAMGVSLFAVMFADAVPLPPADRRAELRHDHAARRSGRG